MDGRRCRLDDRDGCRGRDFVVDAGFFQVQGEVLIWCLVFVVGFR